MKTPQERAKELYKYSPNDSIEIPSYLKGKAEANAEWQEKTEELINALQQLMNGVAGLPRLSAIAGVLEKQYKQAEQAIKT